MTQRDGRRVLIYLHGFNSSSRSVKAQQLRQHFQQAGRESEFLCPDLPHRPAQAIQLLDDMLDELLAQHDQQEVLLMGSSLGGWYATVLAERHNVRAVLLNPAVRPHRLLEVALGEQTNYSNGQRYTFTREHLDELVALDLTALQHPERLLVLLETGDQTLDYREAERFYAASRRIIEPGGNHACQSFLTHLPTLLSF